MIFDAEVAVIGAGVVGLAVARQLAADGFSVMVFERQAGPGRETSSRNSEVIHAGIYYPTGSLKARLCVQGNPLLYEFCTRFGVSYRRLGKLIIALTEEELPELERLKSLGDANGVGGLRLLSQREVQVLEPHVRARAGLLSPSTGIVDSHGVIKTLEAETRRHGGQVIYQCTVRGLERIDDGYRLLLENPAGQEWLQARLVVNCAGLESDTMAALLGITLYRLSWCKGEYFAVSGPSARRVSRLIYPVPSHHLTSLGVHVTLDLAGRMRLGPDITYIDRQAVSLEVDEQKQPAFFGAVQQFLPDLQPDELQPDIAGIRPKLQGPADPWRDFVISEEREIGFPGLVNLVGIESPGLTSCLSIGNLVGQILKYYKDY
jgi:L-2-hydroxyglutarate oxidase LhgO